MWGQDDWGPGTGHVKFVLSAGHLVADVGRKLNAGVLSSEKVQTGDKL